MNRQIASRHSIALGALLALANPVAAEETPLNALATVGMIADVAQKVAGECAKVSALLGSGTDPHYYSATPSDVDALAAAELIFYVDRALEERLADVLDGFRARTPTFGLASASFSEADLLEDPDEPGELDPHLWMDVSRWARIAPVIADAIAAQRPDCADAMADNVAALEVQMDALHGWVGDAIASIPEGNRMLVTAHDAFYYFADAYGIEASEAIEGISTASEASIGDIREVADFVIANNVPAVFVETTINPRTIEALVAEVQSRGHDVVIGGEVFSDAMGDEGTPEGTYIGMIRANTVTITEALGGTLPDWPEALQAWAQEWRIAP
ncbi:MAG: manganese transporter [Rhodobacteraceae bacterium]|nr:MAG: manganese transporter [Paracoccaceae bacterium]